MNKLKTLSSLLMIFVLSACAEAELASHVIKTSPVTKQSKTQGTFKVGSPYKIAGIKYTPQEDYHLVETGIASWYGPNFHGKPTANGETFDQNELTAAHRTLQLPSLVRVTNLENGRSLVVRVNDRGPFSRGRVIDLSKKAADLLGFIRQGTAKVRLEVLTQESLAIAEAAKRGIDTGGFEIAMNENGSLADVPALSPPQQQTAPLTRTASVQNASVSPVERQALSAPPQQGLDVPGHTRNGTFYPDPVVKQSPIQDSKIYVQAGSFGSADNANRFAKRLEKFGEANVYQTNINNELIHRVRIGPVKSTREADRVLEQLSTNGYGQAIVIVD